MLSQALALWRYGYNNVKPHSSLDNKTARQKRAGRLSNLGAPHPARLPKLKPTTINLEDSRYERGMTGGQVTSSGFRLWRT